MIRRTLKHTLGTLIVGLIIIALWRYFPIIAQFTEAAALNIRRLWWLVLAFLLVGAAILAFKKK